MGAVRRGVGGVVDPHVGDSLRGNQLAAKRGVVDVHGVRPVLHRGSVAGTLRCLGRAAVPPHIEAGAVRRHLAAVTRRGIGRVDGRTVRVRVRGVPAPGPAAGRALEMDVGAARKQRILAEHVVDRKTAAGGIVDVVRIVLVARQQAVIDRTRSARRVHDVVTPRDGRVGPEDGVCQVERPGLHVRGPAFVRGVAFRDRAVREGERSRLHEKRATVAPGVTVDKRAVLHGHGAGFNRDRGAHAGLQVRERASVDVNRRAAPVGVGKDPGRRIVLVGPRRVVDERAVGERACSQVGEHGYTAAAGTEVAAGRAVVRKDGVRDGDAPAVHVEPDTPVVVAGGVVGIVGEQRVDHDHRRVLRVETQALTGPHVTREGRPVVEHAVRDRHRPVLEIGPATVPGAGPGHLVVEKLAVGQRNRGRAVLVDTTSGIGLGRPQPVGDDKPVQRNPAPGNCHHATRVLPVEQRRVRVPVAIVKIRHPVREPAVEREIVRCDVEGGARVCPVRDPEDVVCVGLDQGVGQGTGAAVPTRAVARAGRRHAPGRRCRVKGTGSQ